MRGWSVILLIVPAISFAPPLLVGSGRARRRVSAVAPSARGRSAIDLKSTTEGLREDALDVHDADDAPHGDQGAVGEALDAVLK